MTRRKEKLAWDDSEKWHTSTTVCTLATYHCELHVAVFSPPCTPTVTDDPVAFYFVEAYNLHAVIQGPYCGATTTFEDTTFVRGPLSSIDLNRQSMPCRNIWYHCILSSKYVIAPRHFHSRESRIAEEKSNSICFVCGTNTTYPLHPLVRIHSISTIAAVTGAAVSAVDKYKYCQRYTPIAINSRLIYTLTQWLHSQLPINLLCSYHEITATVSKGSEGVMMPALMASDSICCTAEIALRDVIHIEVREK